MKISKTVVKVFSLTVFIACAFYANGEDAISMPSSPAMPSVSVPQISNGFYVPGSKDFYSGQKSTTVASSSANSSTSAHSSAVANSSTASNSAQSINSTQIANTQTAQDITSNLVNSALSTSLSGSLTESGSSLINSSQILNSLSSLLAGKTETGSTDQIFTTSAQNIEQATKTVKNDSSVQNSSSPSILRFLINGTDMIPFCKTVFFSSAETDGSFLLTGDCRYELNGDTRNETFYLLFRSTGSKNASQEFSVTASVFQNKEDSSTYLYALTKIGNLTAQKTGNLISLKSKENGTTLNMLLSF